MTADTSMNADTLGQMLGVNQQVVGIAISMSTCRGSAVAVRCDGEVSASFAALGADTIESLEDLFEEIEFESLMTDIRYFGSDGSLLVVPA